MIEINWTEHFDDPSEDEEPHLTRQNAKHNLFLVAGEEDVNGKGGR
jgi:hypothetical protein